MVWEINSESEQSGATAEVLMSATGLPTGVIFRSAASFGPSTGNMKVRHLSWYVVTGNNSFNVLTAEFLAMHSSEGRTDTPICNSLLALTFRGSRCSSNQPLPFFIKT
jgi:hypothetical protein